MEIRLYDEDIIEIIASHFKISRECVDVNEDNGLTWFTVEPKRCQITIKEVE